MTKAFDVANDHLMKMTPEEAVFIFQRLLWAEASRTGLAITNVNISGSIDIKDGGLDASVSGVNNSSSLGLFKPGTTGYQLKTGTSFKPWQPKQVENELFGSKGVKKQHLGSSVRNCLDKNGTYILVCFSHDLNEKHKVKSENNIRDLFAACGYVDPKVEVWSCNQLVAFLKCFPSLGLDVTGLNGFPFQSHESWRKNSDMYVSFQIGEVQEKSLEMFSRKLRNNIEPVHIRVTGDPGIGKTRFVLEGTSAPDLFPLVMYCESPNDIQGSDLLNAVLMTDNGFQVILVVDECDQKESSLLWNKLKSVSPRIKLVSISCDYEQTSGSTQCFNVPELGDNELDRIIQSYGVTEDRSRRWVDFCNGSPRVAHIVGQNLKENPEDIFQAPDYLDVWKRFIASADNSDDMEMRHRELVLRSLALFKRFGFESDVRKESGAIAKIVETIAPQINSFEFRRIVHHFKDRGILKGVATLHISPRLLHIKLWKDWWDNYGNDVGSFLEQVNEIPEELRDCFYEMFEYAAESTVAHQITKDLLGDNGVFQTIEDLGRPGRASFFLALTSADPESAVNCLKKTIGKNCKTKLERFTSGRREVIQALEKMAVWRELFPDAAKLLLKLAEAENENWYNNASGLFASLFSPAPRPVAPTEASPEERLPILEEAIESDVKEIRMLAIRACDEALESDRFRRFGRPDHQGLRQDADLWMPSTHVELMDYYRQVWTLLRTELNLFSEDERDEAINVILKRSSRIMRFPYLAKMVVDTLAEFAAISPVLKKHVLSRTTEILQIDGASMQSEVKDRLQRLTDDLIGEDFSSQLHRYVGINTIVDCYDRDGNAINVGEINIERLAQQAASNSDLLEHELSWLVTPDAENAFSFGEKLAKFDGELLMWEPIVQAYSSDNEIVSTDLLSGYLSLVFKNNRGRWEKLLESLLTDDRINRKLTEITARSGVSDEAALRIVAMLESGSITVNEFRFFRVGGFVKHLSHRVFDEIIESLLADSGSSAGCIALDLLASRYQSLGTEQDFSADMMFRVLTHKAFFQEDVSVGRYHLVGIRWKSVALKFLEQYPERSMDLAQIMIRHFGTKGTVMWDLQHTANDVLAEITQEHPEKMWQEITQYLLPSMDFRSLELTCWLQGGDSHHGLNKEVPAIQLIPRQLLWDWIDQDVQVRGPYFAGWLVPSTILIGEWETCLVHEMFKRYGDIEEVRQNFSGSFTSGVWSGPASLHWDNKKRVLEDLKRIENHPNITSWINEEIALLDKKIEASKIQEEREDF